MAIHRSSSPVMILLFLSLSLGAAFAADPQSTDELPAEVKSETLEAKLEEVEADADLPEAAKTKLTALYREALDHLEATSSHNAAAEAFRAAAVTAPQAMQSVRTEYERAQGTTPEESLGASEDTPLPELELILQKEQAGLVAVEEKLADLDEQLNREETRPNVIRQRLTDAKQEQEQLAAQADLPPPADESPALSEAQRSVDATAVQALRAEVRMLNEELLSQPVRVKLLEARQELAAHELRWVRSRVRLLEEAVNRRRQADLASVQDETEAALIEFAGKHPVLMQLAEQNATLGQELNTTAKRLEQLSARDDEINELRGEIGQEFENAREAVKLAGLSQALGLVLQEQRRSLPEVRTFRRKLEDREALIAEFGLRRMRHKEEHRALRDVDAYAEELLQEVEPQAAEQIGTELRALLEKRRELAAKLLGLEERILRELGLADVAQRQLVEIVQEYDDFLAEHLLWIRTSHLTELKDLGTLPDELARLLAPADWLDVGRLLLYQAMRSPLFALLIVAFALLLWKRKWMIDALRASGERLGKPTTDSFALTARAIGLTLLVGVPWPLLVNGAGWQLHRSLEGTSFTSTIGLGLMAISAQFYFIQLSRALCMPAGLAARHFRWSETSLRLLRDALGRLLWTFLPAAFVTYVAINLDPVTLGGMIGRLSFVIIALALGMFFYQILHPRRGVLVDFVQRVRRQPLGWIHRLWFPFLIIVTVALGLLALAGYLYTAGMLIARLIQTTWMIFALLVLNGLAVRWLLVTGRRLAYEAALERRRAEREEKREEETTPGDKNIVPIQVEEPEIDLLALGEESRKLLTTTLVFVGIIGAWLIWSEVLPALRFLDQLTLWHYTVTIEGETQRLPITLADIGLAILIGVGTYVLARHLPAVLEIALLNRFEVSASSRYTIITLTTYVIVAIGILLALSTIGARWSQLQWLVAALGVGIGFGLQEIVANFISGLIILFERPIRVGDIVTVGDTDGVVTRIRIRATTIRNWDRKELLVPNKEFITGRLLNWSLSDEMTRVVVVVGVAYGSDVDRALELMREAAEEHEHVLDDPKPILSFEGFGDNALTLILRAYLGSIEYRIATITDLHRAINRKFNEAGIDIAFPQRDVHLDTSSPLKVEVERQAGSTPAGTGQDQD